MLVSRDLDCTNTVYIQFSFKFIAKGKITVYFLSLLQLYSYIVASQKRTWIYVFNFTVHDPQFTVDNMGTCFEFLHHPYLATSLHGQ